MDNEINDIVSESLTLVFDKYVESNEDKLPYYRFNIRHNSAKKIIGYLNLRLDEELATSYQGNIYCYIDEEYQGHRYSYQAIALSFKFFRDHDVKRIYLGCSDDNLAAKKICSLLGAELLEVEEKPNDCVLDDESIYRYAVYSLDIPEEDYINSIKEEHSSMAVVFCEDKVLTLLTVENKLVLPKGHIEKDEKSMQAAIRECYEETGALLIKEDHICEVEPIDYTFNGENYRNLTDLQFYAIFHACAVHKIVDVHFFKVDEELPTKISETENFKKAMWMKIDEFLLKTPYESNLQAITNCLGVIIND